MGSAATNGLTANNDKSKEKMVAKTANQFRTELKKIMPGYKWTLHKQHFKDSDLVATGTQSSGSNRTSTLEVTHGVGGYTARSAGFGAKTPWQGRAHGLTLAQALRNLQTHYERKEQSYRALAAALKDARAV